MELPWLPSQCLEAAVFAQVRLRAIFECCKWDPQVGDVSTLAPYPLVLRASAWSELSGLAEHLASETLSAECEVLQRPELHRQLALPRAMRSLLGSAAPPTVAGVRVMRFDFHFTQHGWQISEANTDVPGGYNEASGFTRLVAAANGHARPAGDPAEALCAAIEAATAPNAVVALVHATAYSDDRQVVVFLARRLAARGRRPMLVAPDHLSWTAGRASLREHGNTVPAGLVYRFFPAEWLPNLPRSSGWQNFFAGARTPLCNPGAALLTQSKRLPLVWDSLSCALPTWRKLLPETRDPRAANWQNDPDWVLKPAWGRVGDDIGLAGVTPAEEWRSIQSRARWWPGQWIAQRRFEPVALPGPGAPVYPCVGVYTVNGRAAGAYGRVSPSRLINHCAQDVAVLVHEPERIRHSARRSSQELHYERVGTV